MINYYVKAREAVLRAWKDESGASLAEYALLIALVLIGAGVALGALVAAVNTALGSGTTALTTAATAPAPSGQ